MDADRPSSPSSPDSLVPETAADSTADDERSFRLRLAVFVCVVIAAIIGAVLLREGFGPRRIAAAALVAAGVALIKLGG